MIDVKEEDGIIQVCATLFTVEATETTIVVTLQTMDDTGLLLLLA